MTTAPAPTNAKRMRVSFEDEEWALGYTQVPNALIRARGIDPNAKMVLITLMSYGYLPPEELPDQEEMASDLCRSPRWLWQQLQELAQRNIILVNRRGLQQTNEYVIRRMSEWEIGPDSHTSANQESQIAANQESHTSASRIRTRLRILSSNKESLRKKEEEWGAVAPTAAPPPTRPAESPSDAPKKERARPLQARDPQVYADREAIKAHYIATTGQQPNAYTNKDCEALARDFGAADSIATIDAMWAFTWADGRYPYRRPLKLSTAHELVPCWRRGELKPETRQQSRVGQRPAYNQGVPNNTVISVRSVKGYLDDDDD